MREIHRGDLTKHKERSTKIKDLISPVDSPKRDTKDKVLLIERKDGKEDNATEKEKTSLEKYEKQVEDDDDDAKKQKRAVK